MGSSSTKQEGIEPSLIMTEELSPLLNIRKRKFIQTDMARDARLDPVHENETILPNLEYSVAHLKDPLQDGNKQTHMLTKKKTLEEIKSLLEQQNVLNRQIFNGINELKNTVGKQNTQITNVLSNQRASLKTSVTSNFEAQKFTMLFPISSEEELYAFESMITEENQSEAVFLIKRKIGPKGIEKGICHIFSNKLIFEYNVNGICGKKRLLDYKNTINVLFLALSDGNTSLVDFKIQLRKAIKTAKTRYFSAEYMKRKRVNDTNGTTFKTFEEENSQSISNEPACSSYN